MHTSCDLFLLLFFNPITKEGGGHIMPPLRFFAFYPNRRGRRVAQITDLNVSKEEEKFLDQKRTENILELLLELLLQFLGP